jgi:hypothetical protein
MGCRASFHHSPEEAPAADASPHCRRRRRIKKLLMFSLKYSIHEKKAEFHGSSRIQIIMILSIMIKHDFILRPDYLWIKGMVLPNFLWMDTYASIPYEFEKSIQPHF